MTHGSLFSGIGGFDLAAEWMGWENKFHCEWNEFGQKVLHHYWPDAELFTDVTKSDFKKYHGAIDIISGGFPCQPYSMAGKRLGKEDDRHLWPEMLRVIREVRPRWVVGENVLGLVNWNGGLVFHEVQTDLESQGYEVQPFVLPACAVNAPHRRDRVWFVAKNTRINGCVFRKSIEKGAEVRQQRDISAGDTERVCGEEMAWITADAAGESSKRVQLKQRKFGEQEQRKFGGNGCEMGSGWDAANADSKRRGKSNFSGITEKQIILNRTFDAGISNWEKFPTQSPVCGRNDGIPAGLDGITFSKWRQESVKAYGNAVVPQVVYQIFKAIETYEKLYNERGI